MRLFDQVPHSTLPAKGVKTPASLVPTGQDEGGQDSHPDNGFVNGRPLGQDAEKEWDHRLYW